MDLESSKGVEFSVKYKLFCWNYLGIGVFKEFLGRLRLTLDCVNKIIGFIVSREKRYFFMQHVPRTNCFGAWLTDWLFKASALWAYAFSKSKCPSLCLFVCSLLRYRLKVFLPPLPKIGYPKFLQIRNPWGKVMRRSGLRLENFY